MQTNLTEIENWMMNQFVRFKKLSVLEADGPIEVEPLVIAKGPEGLGFAMIESASFPSLPEIVADFRTKVGGSFEHLAFCFDTVVDDVEDESRLLYFVFLSKNNRESTAIWNYGYSDTGEVQMGEFGISTEEDSKVHKVLREAFVG